MDRLKQHTGSSPVLPALPVPRGWPPDSGKSAAALLLRLPQAAAWGEQCGDIGRQELKEEIREDSAEESRNIISLMFSLILASVKYTTLATKETFVFSSL